MVLSAQFERPLTYDDLVAMPDDGKRYELIGGELYEVPAPDFFHQHTMATLTFLLSDFAVPRRLGVAVFAPIDVRFDPRNIVQPDVVYISRKRRECLTKSDFQFVDGAPDLLAEISSQESRYRDRVKKSALHATFGVKEYWIVDIQAQTIFVQVLRDGLFAPLTSDDGIVHSQVLPGLEVEPRQVLSIPDWIMRTSHATE